MALRAQLLDADGVPATRIFFAVDEATAAQVAGADGGRASDVAEYHYTSPGRAGQAWRARGTIDPDYGRLEASLTASTGPWTDIGAGSLADPSSAGTAKTLWLRYVAHRWSPSIVSPDFYFEIGLYFDGAAAVDED
jgi:hypothetical protein